MVTGRISKLGAGMRRAASVLALVAAAPMAALPLIAPTPAVAQEENPFAPRVTVNGSVITNFEIAQRALFLRALRLPGDPEKEAIRALIEDRLGQQAAKAAGVTVSAEDIAGGMTEFAARANLSAEEFTMKAWRPKPSAIS